MCKGTGTLAWYFIRFILVEMIVQLPLKELDSENNLSPVLGFDIGPYSHISAKMSLC